MVQGRRFATIMTLIFAFLQNQSNRLSQRRMFYSTIDIRDLDEGFANSKWNLPLKRGLCSFCMQTRCALFRLLSLAEILLACLLAAHHIRHEFPKGNPLSCRIWEPNFELDPGKLRFYPCERLVSRAIFLVHLQRTQKGCEQKGLSIEFGSATYEGKDTRKGRRE